MGSASLPLLIILPLLILTALAGAILYLRRTYQNRLISQNIKERPLPNLFSNVYMSHQTFKKDVVPPTEAPLKANSVRMSKTGSDLSVFREEALTAAPLIYAAPKSAPAYPGHSKSQTNLARSRSNEAMA